MVHHLHLRPARHTRRRGCYSHPVNTVYVIAVVTSLNCGVDVLCLRAVEPDSTGHTQTYPTQEACTAALHRLMLKATHQLDLRCVPQDSALPYVKK
jgi:hypothetical protein